MNRRHFLSLAAALPGIGEELEESKPIPEPHFPSRLYCFVWRNWELANIERLARVLRTTTRNVLALGRSMGLPRKPRLTDDQLRRLYITVIRQNWHLLPEEQLMELLGWDRSKFEYTLKEDDFLDVKLGRNKPRCERLLYQPPSAAERQRAGEIRQILDRVFGTSLHEAGQPPFHFVGELSSLAIEPLHGGGAMQASEVDLRDGWGIHPFPGSARAHLARYLEERFGVKGAPEPARGIRLRLSAGPMQWDVQRDAVTLQAADEAGLMQVVYLLEDALERREAPILPLGRREFPAPWSPRFLYSYVALYGDPLVDTSADPFPPGYLDKLARSGINGVWLQGVLNTLAPSPVFPEFGKGWETRLKNLAGLCDRAAQFGMKVYLYQNEPRAMPASFFENRSGLRGARFQNLYSLCTSTKEVRQWLSDSLAHVFHHVPQLGGIFTISMSENHTNCFSHGGAWRKEPPTAGDCPRCSKRESWEVLGEMFAAMREGVRRSSKSAEIIHWDWGWGDGLAAQLIPRLDKDVKFQSISEWSKPVERGGVKTQVGEYSISVPGPGPRALRNWGIAREAGITALAKVQFNNTWEMSAVPYLPVPHLILEHCENLGKTGIRGLMVSWTCGGFPSPNLEAAKAFYYHTAPDREAILRDLASQRYGSAAQEDAVEAWRLFSEAFREFPYGVQVYIIPAQHGPANLLRAKPTGHRPGMILFPHDAMKAWCGAYPPEVVQAQFTLLAGKWKAGLDRLERVPGKSTPAKRGHATTDLAVALTCYHHFQSVANQVEFYRLRDSTNPGRGRMKELALAERELARRQYSVARSLSTIAYEASNHYYYRPLDLAEKVLNCEWLLTKARML
jgi:hypothetical protein